MPIKNNCISFLFFLCFTNSFLFGQTQTANATKETISSAIESYFELERENIHVQLDKNVFMINETIWFKGYVYNKKLNLWVSNKNHRYGLHTSKSNEDYFGS